MIGDGARALPDKSHGWFRDWFRKVWEVRGGGLYACGFALAFLWFELGSLREDFTQIGSLFNGNIISFVVDFLIDSLTNTIRAFAWPAYVVAFAPPWGMIGLALAYFGFAKYLKPPITRWLFPGSATE